MKTSTLLQKAIFLLTLAMPASILGPFALANPGERTTAQSLSSVTKAYVGATLIDGTGRAPVLNAIVLVNDGRIVAAGSPAKIRIPTNAKTVSVSEKWIVPGLVDAHSHFMESGRIYTMPRVWDFTDVVPYDEEIAWMRARLPIALQSFVCAGVTSTLSAGGARIEYDARKIAQKTLRAPNVFVAHGPISLVPSEAIFPPFEGDTPIRTAKTPAEGAARVREGKAWGTDLIKTGYLGGPFTETEKNHVEVHRAIISEAHKLGFPVTTHVTELEPARALVRAGVDSLQHLPSDAPVDDAFVNLMLEKGTMVVPTLAVYTRMQLELPTRKIKLLPIEQRCGDPEVIESWTAVELPAPSPEQLTMVKARLTISRKNASRLYRAGVPIAAGSDAGVTGLLYGSTLHYELKLLGEIGMTNLDLIKAATLNSARVAGKDDMIGSIEPGKRADFLILSADPLEDISNLQKIESVVKDGIDIKQDDLLPPGQPADCDRGEQSVGQSHGLPGWLGQVD